MDAVDQAAEEPAEGRQPPERQEPDLTHPGGHLHGVVARMNRPRRFGFLRSDDGVEVFFHASALEAGPNAFDALRPGQEMEWDCHQDEQGRGLAATTVTILGEPPERPARPPRPERAERPSRAERGGRQKGGQQTGWRVSVLTERGDQTVAAQLERLLNERGVKPGNFTFNLTETDDGVECWVAIYTGA
jgi:cold shock CspA family protein